MRTVVLFLLAISTPLLFADEKRNLSLYDLAGPFQITLRTEDQRFRGVVREFLWTHWRDHRRGTVGATTQYVEGFVRTTYFVEPNKNGLWQIVQLTNWPYHKAPDKRFACTKFERIEPDGLHFPFVVVSDQEERPPEKYLLHPICSKGPKAKLW